MPYRIQLANITRLNKSSYFPDSTSTADHALKTRIETPGVWYLGLTRPMAEKKYPCRGCADLTLQARCRSRIRSPILASWSAWRPSPARS